MLTVLTKDQTKKIQIDEGIVITNFGETDEMIIGPTRGGAEFTATPSIRDIEYDGRKGKSKGLEIKDSEDVTLKITTLCCSQAMLKLALPNATVNSSTNTITQGKFGVIEDSNYLKNVAVVTQMLDGTFKVLKVLNAMHEGAFTYKAASKSENEHNLEFLGHYDPFNNVEQIYEIKDYETNPIVTGE